ncbi:hypothetical protein [Neptunomonas antarctica]|uniref:Uncharacterized protein n=1 Tax=Neptunomonas antarctica TaxID=619304 RepID=A0A1N7NCF5_9GAMM|nr:hypothetical protein [Neptunomonas antarctica]SIS95948.1 hypothetical protein SAMN05421760_1091 [Neptunomonas antarctica]
MELSIIYIVSVFFAIFTLVAFVAIRAQRMRTPEETGLHPEIEEICGGRINLLNYTWPLVRHAVYKEFIVLSCIGGTYIIPRESLIVEVADGLFSSGIRYSSPKYLGCELRVWTLRKNEVFGILGINA